MVKIHDGSLVPASELLSNNAEDDEGNKLKFEQVKDAAYPTFQAKSKVPDDSGRKRTYRFSFEDTNVTVHMTISEPRKEGASAGDAKAGGDSASAGGVTAGGDKATAGGAIAGRDGTESKKNSSEPQQKLTPPDYRLRRSPT